MPSNNDMIAPIFKDQNLQLQFDTEGYVKISLLNDADIKLLTELFYEFHDAVNDNSFGASSFINNQALKLKIRDALYPIYLPYFEKIFHNYTYFGSSFLYKTPGKNSDLSPHQDWTIVDEEKFVAVNIWTPLIDTDERNGTLYVVPKSQSQKLFSLRAPTIPFYFQNYFDTVIKCSIPTNAKAGEAVILNQSLIHCSSPNNSDKIRLAITSGLKSKDAPMLFHYRNEQNEIERYEMPEDFLLSFDNFETDIYKSPENGKKKNIINYQPPKISKSAFIGKFSNEPLSFINKIRCIIDQVF